MPASESAADEALGILRGCVHCGFCTATCPTYQITGDELDGPRGRIYLMKALLAGEGDAARTRRHLDRCLECRGCETTCPSGVRYGRLLELVRARLPRPWVQRAQFRLLRAVIPHRARFAGLARLSRALGPLLPSHWRISPPRENPYERWPERRHPRRMLLLQSCAQESIAPRTNLLAARLLDRLGIELMRVPQAGCCGELGRHLGALDAAKQLARRNIDAWWPLLAAGAEAVVVTASGCGSAVKHYGTLLADDEHYRDRAAQVAALTRDVSEVAAQELAALDGDAMGAPREDPIAKTRGRRVALHLPCSLQHGQKLGGLIERLLTRAGHELIPAAESHLCCGAAGPYALLQPRLSRALRDRKLAHLSRAQPEVIATANIGCQMQLQSGSAVPVVHWIELL